MALGLSELIGVILAMGSLTFVHSDERFAIGYPHSYSSSSEEAYHRPHHHSHGSNSQYGNHNHGPHEDPFVFDQQNTNSQSRTMQVLYSWKQPDFVFPNEGIRERMIRDRQFVPLNTLIMDVDVYGEGPNRKVFVTLPRTRPGVPVTLATVSHRYRKNGAYLLEPYPDWQSNTAPLEGRCDDGITSVFRTHVDECGRLWVLDSGNNNIFAGNSTIVCQPKVLIFDLRNNRLIGKYPIPNSMIANNTLLVTIAVDIRRGECNNAFAYLADSIAYKMYVFNLRSQQFWRINSILFFPYPDQSRFLVSGVSFDLTGGVFGLALGPLHQGNKRILYFHSIAGVRQSWVDTDELRNQSLWRDNMNSKPRAFNLFDGSRPSQSAAATMDEEGLMFFGLLGSNEIGCWNSQKTFNRENIGRLGKDDNNLQFNSGIKVYKNKLYAATNRLQNFLTNQVKPNEENYRVLAADVDQLTRGTQCEVSMTSNRFADEYMPDMESVDFPADLVSSSQ